jgi:beta-glucosidase-like glycosyl hydrolase
VPISKETIKRSLKGHMNTSEKMFNGVVLSDSMRDVLTSSVADYE